MKHSGMAAAALMVMIPCFKLASQIMPYVLHVKSYVSPSGKWSLQIDPGDRYGRGAGDYRMSAAGREVWRVELPFTLGEAEVSDDGVTVGYAYSHSVAGFGKDGPGTLNVVIIDAKGAVRLNEVVKREETRVLHGLPEPQAKGIILLADEDRFIMRMTAEKGESWAVYRLSTGEKLKSFDLRSAAAVAGGTRFVIGTRRVAGLPLNLLQWWRYEEGKTGALFTLNDLDGHTVWSLDLPADYSVQGDEKARDLLRDEIWESSAILDAAGSNSFELRFVAANERARFSVTRDGDRWSVKETSRAKYEPPPPDKAAPAIAQPPMLKLIGSFVLRDQPKIGPIRDISEFAFDDGGQIGFLRREESRGETFVLIDQNGHVLAEIALPVTAQTQTHIAWLAGSRWIIVASGYGEEAKARAWWLDVEKQTLTEIKGFDCFAIEHISGAGDGGFVVLAQRRQRYSSTDQLARFDALGTVRWKHDAESDGKPESLFSPEDITVIASKEIAVLDNIRRTVQLFDLSGAYLRTISLKDAWKREPHYPSGIKPDADGGFIVHDFHGSPPYVRMKPDGSVRAEFLPKHGDGRVIDAHDRVCAAPDGKLWASDGQAFMQLSEQGIAVRTLGAAPDENTLGHIAAVTGDARGQVYAVDERTGAVHVFGPDGVKLRVCKPAKDDFSAALQLPHVAVATDGSVFLSGGNFDGVPKHLLFASDGTRIGVRRFGIDRITEKYFSQPGSTNILVVGYETASLVSADGKLLRTMDRQPDRRWLDHPQHAAFAGDGSFAIQSETSVAGKREQSVTFFTVEGVPVSAFSFDVQGFAGLHGFNGRLVSIGSDEGVAVHDRSGRIVTVTPKTADWRTHFFTRDGRELWVVDIKARKVDRYELP